MIQRFYKDWETYKVINYFYIIDSKVVSTLSLEIDNDSIILDGVYTLPEYRNNNYSKHLIMASFNDYDPNKEFYLLVNKTNHIAIHMYKQFNFKYCEDYKFDNNYEWMIYHIK